jgi:hypothetical protein
LVFAAQILQAQTTRFGNERSVERIPVAINKAKISRICGKKALEPVLPPMSIILAKPTWATMAPSFPEAAEIPWKVDR